MALLRSLRLASNALPFYVSAFFIPSCLTQFMPMPFNHKSLGYETRQGW
jgi:hypothetical protein